MKHWAITGLIGIFMLGSTSAVAANDHHLVLNGFSQEVHATDGYEGILGTGARTLSWWYRSHESDFPVVWGLVHWGWNWTVQPEKNEGGILNLEAKATSGGTKFGWSALRNPEIASMQDGQWHHLAITAPSAGTMEDVRLYLDGSNMSVVTVAGGSLTSAYNTPSNLPGSIFRIGARPLGNHANVDMDEVALWNVELSAAAVAEIFNDGVPTDLTQNGTSYTSQTALQLYWTFEEAAGLATTDLSGNGHHGALIAGDTVDSWGSNPPGSGSDFDGDGILDGFDNCPDEPNAGQEDADLDQIGDACDPFPNNPDNEQAQAEADRDACLTAAPQCTDGIDNDGDGLIDFGLDPECVSPHSDTESPRSCGLGFELALILPGVMWLHRRHRRLY